MSTLTAAQGGANTTDSPDRRFFTPDSIDLPTRVCRCIYMLASFPVIGLVIIRWYALAVCLALVATAAFVIWVGLCFFAGGYREAMAHAAKDYAHSLKPVAEVDPNAWYSIPPASEGHGHLYVIRFETGVVKVGQTNNLSRRIAEHRRDAFAYNIVITDLWVSQEHDGYLTNETKLIAFANSMAGRMRREYFHGADFHQVVDFADTLVGGTYYDNRRA